MAKRSSKAHLIPEARDMYIAGASVSEIADSLNVNRHTIASWKRKETGADSDWDSRKTAYQRRSPRFLLGILEVRRESLILDIADGADEHVEDRLVKLQKVIDRIEAKLDDPQSTLDAIEDVVGYCVAHQSEERLATLRAILEDYADHRRNE